MAISTVLFVIFAYFNSLQRGVFLSEIIFNSKYRILRVVYDDKQRNIYSSNNLRVWI